MPGKKNYNSRSKRGGKTNNRSNYNNRAMQQQTTRFYTVTVPFRCTQTSSGTGGITTVESSSSLTAANSTSLDPYTIGGRVLQFTNQFLQYRVVGGSLTYVPDVGAMGISDVVTGGTTTPTYTHRSFAMAIFKDPALSTISYENLLAAGGSYGATERSHSCRLPVSPWLWTSTTASSPTTIDLRMTAFGKFYFSFFNTSTTATASYGHFVLRMHFICRGAVDNAGALGKTISSTSSPSTPIIEDEDEKAFTEVKKSTTTLAVVLPRK